MINIVNKVECCGCTACANACPKNAIHMRPDEEGFLYPEINTELCIQCNICNKVCPVVNKLSDNKFNQKSYVLRSKIDEILMQSTSGGFVTPLANWVLENNGVMCGASYDKDFKVTHVLLEKTQGADDAISRFRGSKYVQSDLNNCFFNIKKCLERKQLVCFVGTTCQVNGLKAYIRKDYEELICVDLVCHGTPSPKLWDKYLSYQKEKYHSEIEEISFRNKTYGYHSGTMKIRFSNGKTYYGSARVDYMLKSFFKEIASRPICYQCPFKELKRCSDFTIYDCWHAAELVPGLKDDDRGYTNVIVQSSKGKKILEQIKDRYEIYPVDTDKAVELDGSMVLKSAVPHKKRAEYYCGLNERTIEEHVQNFIPVSRKDYLIERVKIVIYRIGIYGFLKKIMKR